MRSRERGMRVIDGVAGLSRERGGDRVEGDVVRDEWWG